MSAKKKNPGQKSYRCLLTDAKTYFRLKPEKSFMPRVPENNFSDIEDKYFFDNQSEKTGYLTDFRLHELWYPKHLLKGDPSSYTLEQDSPTVYTSIKKHYFFREGMVGRY